MAITVERIDEDHWAIHCTDGEWEDIKKVLAYGEASYLDTSLFFSLPKVIVNGKKDGREYENLIETNQRLSAPMSNKRVMKHDLRTMIGTFSYFEDFDRGVGSGVPAEQIRSLSNLLQAAYYGGDASV
jgi:hypothetical protein